MKTFTLTLTEDEAHAVGYALKNAVRALRAPAGPLSTQDPHKKDLVLRLERSYSKLDTAPEGDVLRATVNELRKWHEWRLQTCPMYPGSDGAETTAAILAAADKELNK